MTKTLTYSEDSLPRWQRGLPVKIKKKYLDKEIIFVSNSGFNQRQCNKVTFVKHECPQTAMFL